MGNEKRGEIGDGKKRMVAVQCTIFCVGQWMAGLSHQ